jgi:hypothetical protein
VRTGKLLSGYGSYVKATDGAIVQFVSAPGERRTIVARGVPPQRAAVGDEGVRGSLLRAIAEMETWPGEWKVEVISTPATILTDLQGNRLETHARPRGAVSPSATSLHLPEPNLLSMVGRIDLLASR